ncbi:Tegument protein G48 [Eptesicus fuscus gammaherpesvirus]|uniref:Tegument protein G48 n=1 Tax=vespertilionid gammaherpesvirus 3 TaxID=2846598 RepID=A0A2D1A5N4_9GAMA|nr:Tegument protein G48 [Eptesicus fuscus gammaherpesvirus]ATA58274.1 Tegument protein G48 [Eptesicus fuscus gammaherpesvirus]
MAEFLSLAAKEVKKRSPRPVQGLGDLKYLAARRIRRPRDSPEQDDQDGDSGSGSSLFITQLSPRSREAQRRQDFDIGDDQDSPDSDSETASASESEGSEDSYSLGSVSDLDDNSSPALDGSPLLGRPDKIRHRRPEVDGRQEPPNTEDGDVWRIGRKRPRKPRPLVDESDSDNEGAGQAPLTSPNASAGNDDEMGDDAGDTFLTPTRTRYRLDMQYSIGGKKRHLYEIVSSDDDSEVDEGSGKMRVTLVNPFPATGEKVKGVRVTVKKKALSQEPSFPSEGETDEDETGAALEGHAQESQSLGLDEVITISSSEDGGEQEEEDMDMCLAPAEAIVLSSDEDSEIRDMEDRYQRSLAAAASKAASQDLDSVDSAKPRYMSEASPVSNSGIGDTGGDEDMQSNGSGELYCSEEDLSENEDEEDADGGARANPLLADAAPVTSTRDRSPGRDVSGFEGDNTKNQESQLTTDRAMRSTPPLAGHEDYNWPWID